MLSSLAWCIAPAFQANKKTAETVSLWQIISQPDKYRDSQVTIRVRVKTWNFNFRSNVSK